MYAFEKRFGLKENEFRRNEHLFQYWNDFTWYEQEHFYHIGAKEANRHPMIEILAVKPNWAQTHMIYIGNIIPDTAVLKKRTLHWRNFLNGFPGRITIYSFFILTITMHFSGRLNSIGKSIAPNKE